MKDMGLKYIIREVDFSTQEELIMADVKYDENQKIIPEFYTQAIYTRLLMLMAKDKNSGFFLNADTESLMIITRKCANIDISTLKKVIDSCLNYGLFDKNVYKKYKILTSQDIQEKYFFSRTVKRRFTKYLEEYKPYIYKSILSEIGDFQKDSNKLLVSKNGSIGSILQQTKQDKTKQNETKQNETERETKQTLSHPKTTESKPKNEPPKDFISLTDSLKDSLSQFIKKYPNKECELNFKVPKNLDVDILTKKVAESDFLKTLGNLDAKWCCQHYDEIVANSYTDFEKKPSKKDYNYSQRDYTGYDFNSLFDNIEEIEL